MGYLLIVVASNALLPPASWISSRSLSNSLARAAALAMDCGLATIPEHCASQKRLQHVDFKGVPDAKAWPLPALARDAGRDRCKADRACISSSLPSLSKSLWPLHPEAVSKRRNMKTGLVRHYLDTLSRRGVIFDGVDPRAPSGSTPYFL